MASLSYFNTKDINPLQLRIMQVVEQWTRTQKTLVPQKEIIQTLSKEEIKSGTVVNALHGLIRKGYIRRSDLHRSTKYIQLRSV